MNRLREVQSKSKIAIVMTDGQNNSGKVPPLTAAEAAQAHSTKVYTIGVGTHGQAPVPAGRNPFTGETMYQMQAVDIDEDTLKEVAMKTGAQYFRADNAEKFEAIYAEIDQLEKTEKEVKKYAQHRELFAWLIGPGLGLPLARRGLISAKALRQRAEEAMANYVGDTARLRNPSIWLHASSRTSRIGALGASRLLHTNKNTSQGPIPCACKYSS